MPDGTELREQLKRADNNIRKAFARGMNRDVAADYIGISSSKFDELVHDGRMPAAKRIDRRKIWDRNQIDRAFENLPDAQGNDFELEVAYAR